MSVLETESFLDFEQLLAAPEALFATSPYQANSHQPTMGAADWATDERFLDELIMATSSPVSEVAMSPAFTDVNDINSPLFSGLLQDSPVTSISSNFSSPQFEVPVQTDMWAGIDDGLMFPSLMSPTKQQGMFQPQMAAQQIINNQIINHQIMPAPAPVEVVAPAVEIAHPLLSGIGPTAASLALNPTVLAAASAATGLDVKYLQQQLQNFAQTQTVQTAPVAVPKAKAADMGAAAAPAERPRTSAGPGRKRKERPTDAAAILAELDMKRQKNTEAARRSRQKRLERLSELETHVKEVEAERDQAKAELEAFREESDAKEGMLMKEMAELRARLALYETAA
ncbi:uncharacterized protein EV422DRAFT_563852 [Fimicolochytrium jonesii]|uniref:uncharacterized protein n=1 Tax=Fimicolochytrium jonesii TaxID=1396493 RepID=UPI0022FDF849|nr:uncharacterized protein EV422DRAFT_563852 [Fimicolochytrium jonesii]KAI8826040.1 hypothetical protein EV422DRAFT_563852 [Fimicolochytrium jonesii]